MASDALGSASSASGFSRLYASSHASGSSSTLESFFSGRSPSSSSASIPVSSSVPLSESLPQRASRPLQSFPPNIRRATAFPLSSSDDGCGNNGGSGQPVPSVLGEAALLDPRSHDYERMEAMRQQRTQVLSNLGPNPKLEGELGIEARSSRSTGLVTQLAPSSASSRDSDASSSQQQQQQQAQSVQESHHGLSSAFLVSYFVAGGAAGATSRTVVSPLERLKIIMQVQPHDAAASAKSGSAKGAYSGVWTGLVKMWKEEGFAGFMRGNGINCLRIAPYSAVQFTTYELAKDWLRSPDGELDVSRRLTAGAIAGMVSVVSTYPLDLVRSRISIASASMYNDAKSAAIQETKGPVEVAHVEKVSAEALRKQIAEKQKQVPGIWEMTVKVYREEGGMRGLYRGCVPTSVGVAPYVALNFVFYEAARTRLAPDGGSPSALGKLACGALAGSISQTLTYPLDVLRRRMQVAGMKDSHLGYHDKNGIDCIRNIVRAEGVRGLYRGLLPNLLKVAPSIGTSFLTYEAVRGAIETHFAEGEE